MSSLFVGQLVNNDRYYNTLWLLFCPPRSKHKKQSIYELLTNLSSNLYFKLGFIFQCHLSNFQYLCLTKYANFEIISCSVHPILVSGWRRLWGFVNLYTLHCYQQKLHYCKLIDKFKIYSLHREKEMCIEHIFCIHSMWCVIDMWLQVESYTDYV